MANARSEIVGPARDSLAVINTISNTSGHSTEMDVSPCVAGFSVYANASRSGTPVWEHAPWKDACDAIKVTRFILASGSMELRIVQKLPPNFPRGRFYVKSILRTIQPEVVSIPAGEFEYAQ